MGLINQKTSNRFVQFLLKSLRKTFAIFLFGVRKISFNKLPPIPVASVIVEKRGKFLGIERSDGLGISLPAGIINWNEAPEETALRETKEETGLTVRITNLFGVYTRPKRGTTDINIINIVYQGNMKGGKLKNSHEGKAGWFTLKQFSKKDAGFKEVITDYLKKEVHERIS